ncbi:MAG: FG-GAP repeat domain-containing protein [Anaerolineae bacterium]|jgi:predicted nucleotidyltransferase
MKHRFIRLSIALGLCLIFVLLAGLVLHTTPTEAASSSVSTSSMDQTSNAIAACGGDFTLASSDPTGVYLSDAAWGDYDDDGDLDILLSGHAGSESVTEVWRNDGSGTFTLASSDPTNIYEGSVAWGDYDDDGDLDILLAGYAGSGSVTEVWRNDGGGTFTLASSAPTGVAQGDVAWGDYDDDGDLDILLAGHTGSTLTTEVWRNEDGLTFTQAITALTGIYDSNVAWGDYDDDGDLDILLAGSAGANNRVTEIWRNEDGAVFTQAITNITGIDYGSVAWGDYDNDGDLDILLGGWASGGPVTEVWRNNGGDDFSLASADPTAIFGGSVAWGDYDDDGDLDILLAAGSLGGETTEVWRNDGGGTFTLASTAPPGIYQGGAAWGDYDDDGDLDILVTGDTGSGLVTEVWRNPRCPTPRTFTQISTTLTGIEAGDVAWGDYDDDGDPDILLTGNGTEVWRNEGDGTFSLASTAPTDVHSSSAAWGDYDDDGDLDILLAGHTGSAPTTEVWRNEDGLTFTQAITNITGVYIADTAWGDYDDDGDLDILLSGYTNSGGIAAEVWRNEDGLTFTQAITNITGTSYGSVAWGDYDDDGDIDILLSGYTASGDVTEVWRNEDGLTFTQAITNITGVELSDAAWGDYDDDGDIDILLSGKAGGDYVTEVWRNEDGLTFTQAITNITGVHASAVAWGDYDDDGDLDALIAGWSSSSNYVTEVWRNDGGGTFTLADSAPTGIHYASLAWGDYDNDGDLDILLAGRSASGRITEVWRNGPLQTHLPLVIKN